MDVYISKEFEDEEEEGDISAQLMCDAKLEDMAG
jgi:hypothetical protein